MQSGGRTASGSHWLVARTQAQRQVFKRPGVLLREKIHEAIIHRRQHGVTNTETAAAVAALSMLNTGPLESHKHIPMATAAVHNDDAKRKSRARRRTP